MNGELMGHDEFQTSVIKTLTRLETKMDLLVGPDGNNGKISVIEARVDGLEQTRDQNTGKHQGLSWIKTAVASTLGAGATVAIQKLFGHQ